MLYWRWQGPSLRWTSFWPWGFWRVVTVRRGKVNALRGTLNEMQGAYKSLSDDYPFYSEVRLERRTSRHPFRTIRAL